MNKRYLFISGLILLGFSLAQAEPLPPDKVPPPLQLWVDWVLHDHQQLACPIMHDTKNLQRECIWTSQLQLNIDQQHAYFVQQLQLYQAGIVALPGNADYFPQQVQLNEQPVIVTEHNGMPKVHLAAGIYQLTGQFNWQQRPEYLQIPPHTGLVQLELDEQSIPTANLDPQGRLWLQQGGSQQASESAQNRLDMKVYRQIIDEIPLQMVTRIQLDVAGKHREVILGPALLAEHIPMSLASPLPARLESDGSLRIQVRPGSWLLELRTRQMGNVEALQLPSGLDNWVEEEIWVFVAQNALRLVEITGVVGIDPQQTALPKQWRRYPAYQVQGGQTFTIETRRRGDPEPPPEQLSLQRNFWLDFDGQGYSVQDRISGTLTHSWRLEMAQPIHPNLTTELGRVSVNGENQFITRLAERDNTGVEVRHGNVNLIADSRIADTLTELPAVSWDRDFQQVQATLHFPPGWQLLHATGADGVPGTWLQRWTLLDLFIVLIIATAIGKLWRWYWGALALITLTLTYHEPNAPQFIWLNVLAALALVRVLPDTGVFVWLVRWYRNLSLIALILVVVPFLVMQAQTSLYPQLAYAYHDLAQPMSGSVSLPAVTMTEIAEENFMADDALVAKPPPAPRSYLQSSAAPAQDKFSAKRKKLMQIDPNAQVQTGPGLPQWQWYNSMTLTWHGPVEREQTVRLWLLSPTQKRGLGFAQVLLLTLLTLFLLWQAWQGGAKRWVATARQASGTAASVLLGTLVVLVSGFNAQPVTAAEITQSAVAHVSTGQVNQSPPLIIDFPDSTLLKQLEARLTAPLDCVPHCVSSPHMQLELNAETLSIRQVVHSYADIAIPLPGTAKQWLPQQIWLNEQTPTAIQRKDGVLWLAIPAGIHHLHLQGVLPNRNAVVLPLPLMPRHVTVTSDGWQVEGIRANGVAEKQLQFTRSQAAGERMAELEMGSLPPFVQVARTLSLGLDWQVETQVTRLTPTGTAIVLEIPLLPGESVTSEKVQVEDGKALLNLSPHESQINWVSVFDKQPQLTLTAPDTTTSAEVWKLNASAIWHVQVAGIAVIHHQDGAGNWLPQWRPLPGEQVTLNVVRPEGIAGQVMTIDRSHLSVSPGKRATDSTLQLTLRSSRGGQHVLQLPPDAQLQQVTINGTSQPIRQQGQQVTLPINPGQQDIRLTFRQSTGMQNTFTTPAINLGMASVNSLIEISLPRDRWVLFTGGEPIGPAVKIWSLLAIMVLLAVILGQVKLTPLSTWQWLLLAVVLSQLHVAAALLVVVWLLALGWRGQWTTTDPLYFNFVQLSLAALTVFALLTLIAAIHQGLLGRPDMQIAGNASNGYALRWYQDRISDSIPTVWMYSLPMWVYRIAMLLWALWLAFALLRWLKWGWLCFNHQGLWRIIPPPQWVNRGKPAVKEDAS